MPDYKKKKVHHFGGSSFKRGGRASEQEQPVNIPMRSANTGKTATHRKNSENIRVIKGKKLEQCRRMRIIIITAAIVIAIIITLSWLLPVGIGENVANLLSMAGSGSYPYELYGTETLNAVSKDSYYYILTDTNLDAYSNAGKKIFSQAHGYSHPVLKTSATRSLVFDQNGTGAVIYNLKKKIYTLTTKTPILTAAISRSGVYAVATESDAYAAVVSIYNLNNELLYEWYSSTDMVNNIAISPSGKRIAVSTLNASGGQYSSKVLILGFDSADPVFTADYGGQIIYSLESGSTGYFSVLTENNFSSIEWTKYFKNDYSNERALAMFRTSREGTVLVYNRASDKSDNHVVVLSPKGEKTSEFDYDGILSDIEIGRGHIYCISDTTVSLLDKQGNILRTGQCGYGCVRLAVTGTYSVAVITNSDVSRLEIENKQE